MNNEKHAQMLESDRTPFSPQKENAVWKVLTGSVDLFFVTVTQDGSTDAPRVGAHRI